MITAQASRGCIFIIFATLRGIYRFNVDFSIILVILPYIQIIELKIIF